MSHKGSPGEIKQNLGLRIGPFTYLLQAHDDWGHRILARIQLHLATTCLQQDENIDRYIHLVNLIDDQSQDTLPQQLWAFLPDEEHQLPWSRIHNKVNTLWNSAHSKHTFWVAASTLDLGKLRFDFPWDIVIRDIVKQGGGLLHAGLACHNQNGLLFLAPPYGGKSTTLSTAPSDWLILSDDAALIWPVMENCWYASPLPAWGAIIKPNEEWCYPDMDLNQSCQLKSLLMIKKAKNISLEKLQPSVSLPFIYRALCEYPATIIAESIQTESFFRTASALTRALSCSELALPLRGDIWPLLSREAA